MVPAVCQMFLFRFILQTAPICRVTPSCLNGILQPAPTTIIFRLQQTQDLPILFTAHGWEITLACISVVFLTMARHTTGALLPEILWVQAIIQAHGILSTGQAVCLIHLS